MNELLSCCLYCTASKLNRVITKMADESFSKIGLSPNYAFVLMVVEKNPGISSSDLAKELNLAPSTVTRFIDKLVSKGYVERKMIGKFSYVYLTESGCNIQEEIHKCWESLYHRYAEIIGYEESEEMTKRIDDFANQLIESM